jgi:hypothetical protein
MTKEKTEERNLRPPAVDIYESGRGCCSSRTCQE